MEEFIMTERQMQQDIRTRSQRANMRKNRKGPVHYPVHVVFNRDDDQIWYDIPGFPSYQYSSKGYVRSFKSRNKFPFGQVLGFRHTSNGDMFNLTDRNNVLRILSFDQIKAIVEPTIGKVKGYGTFEVPAGKARNSRYFIDQTIDTTIAGKVTKTPKKVKKEAASMMHFTVVPDEPEQQIITPIHFVEEKT